MLILHRTHGGGGGGGGGPMSLLRHKDVKLGSTNRSI